MKDEFTTAEYIAEHRLGVSVHDPAACRLINSHLTKKGYKRIRKRVKGKLHWVWTKTERSLDVLKQKLEGL